MSDAGPLSFDVSRAWCGFHAMPWRSDWPASAIVPTMALFAAMMGRPEIVEEADGDVDRVQPILDRACPWCCYLERHDPERLWLLYDEAGVERPSLADRAPG